MKRTQLYLAYFIFFLPVTVSHALCSCNDAVKQVLYAQQDAWNNGDIEGYMNGYMRSDSLTFVGGKNVQRGWESTLAGYKNAYPDKAAMGTLSFGSLSVTCTGAKYAVVSGSWQLSYPAAESKGGRFTLLFRKIRKNWRIIYDHTS